MRELPLIIVVGGDDLARRVCEELRATRGHEVVQLWPAGEEALREAGVAEAICIIPVSSDDRLNLQLALKAREMNPKIRIVLRQFNRALGHKIEQNLSDCSAISPAAHAAATYAGAAVDPACIYALQFPDVDGPLVGFSERPARDFGLRDTTVGEAERRLGMRVVSVNETIAPERSAAITRDDRVVSFGPMDALQHAWHRRRRARPQLRRRREWLGDMFRAAARYEPFLIYTFAFALMLFVAGSLYFTFQLHLTFVEAMYFTASTMFTVGYGDITPYNRHGGVLSLFVAMAIMVGGVTIAGIFIASIASAFSRAQETALQGLRRVRAEDHVVVCGAGSTGTRVVDFLLDMQQRVVVLEQRPDTLVLELARTRRIDLLTGDATSDDTLEFCDLGSALSFVAVTDSDTANLEAALGALVQNPAIPVVVRINDPDFSRLIERNFNIAKSFSAAELTAPMIAGLARFPGTRGRVSFAGEIFNVGVRSASDRLPRAEGTVPLYAWRGAKLRPIHDFAEMEPDDRVLYVVPLSQFKAE
jgi:Trk K+ transport system NAD-binding subunit